MNLPKLSPEEQKQFENGVIRVDGTAMNRTALGIVAAFFRLYPNTTFQELKEAFPDSINPSATRNTKSIFKPFTDRDFGVVHSLEEIKNEFQKAELPYNTLFFLEENEMFLTSDGITVIVVRTWDNKDLETGESDLKNLAKQALKFGIYVDKFEFTKAFGKGSYTIEVINNDLFDKITSKTIVIEKEKIVEREVIKEKTIEKKVIPFWVWIILGLGIILLILWLSGVFKSDPVIIEKEVVKTVVQIDTVYVKEIENIEAKFNSVQFSVGSSELPEDAKFALYDLAMIMEKHPEIKIKVEGHTSDEGDVKYNQQLSEKRAKAVVDFIVSRGIDASRFKFEGKGSSIPIDKNNREVNRRTEFIIN